MRSTALLVLLIASLHSFSQIIHTRPFSKAHLNWDEKNDTYKKDTVKQKFKTVNPKILLSFDEIKIIDGDTSIIYLNITPEMNEDSTSVDRIWDEANDQNGQHCFVYLYYFKKENEYGLRILYDDLEEGYEYHMMALKVDVIPYKKN